MKFSPKVEALECRQLLSHFQIHHHQVAAVKAQVAVAFPSTVSWVSPGTRLPYHLNNVWGDCVVAAFDNSIDIRTAVTRKPVDVPDSSTWAHYQRVSHASAGYDPGEWPILGLGDWQRNGLLATDGRVHKIEAWRSVNIWNFNRVKQAVLQYGGMELSLALPTSAITEFKAGQPWTSTTDAKYSAGGHEVYVDGYSPFGVEVATWGKADQWVSWGFFQTYAVEGYATMSQDWIGPNGRTPTGMTNGQALANLRTLSYV